MNHKIAIALVVCLALPCTAMAQQHPNVERGFKPGQAYEVTDVDHVNLFNGNLNVSIPIGGTFKVSDALSYGFNLSYGGNNWDYEQKHVQVSETAFGWTSTAIPMRGMNAGTGWLFSLGRLFRHPSSPSPHWIYQAADGSEHVLYPLPHSDAQDLSPSDVNYSRSSTYMRHKIVRDAFGAVSGHTLELDDDTIREFDAGGQLTKIKDRFGNVVTIIRHTANLPAIPDPDVSACGTSYVTLEIADPFRTHYVYLNATPAYSAFMPERVCQANFAAFGTGVRANYIFRYADRAISRQRTTGPEAYNEIERPTPTVQVPLLTKVELPHGASYEMVYDIGMAGAAGVRSDSPQVPTALSDLTAGLNPGSYTGHLVELRLPTRGRYGWEYRRYTFPPDHEEVQDPRDPSQMGSPTQAAGIKTRKRYVDGNAPDVWTYTSSFLSEHQRTVNITTVTAPDLAVTDHYFSVWNSGLERDRDYGAPYTRRPSSGSTDPSSYEEPNPHPDGLFLSSRTRLPDGRKRVTYVQYEWDPISVMDNDRRLKASLTVFEDGRFTKQVHSDFDGVGHYRTTTRTESNGQIERVETTKFNPGFTATSVIPSNAPWITGTYESVETTDRLPGTNTVVSRSKSFACFDALTGRLQRTRAVRGSDPGTDLLTVFHDRNAAGGEIDGNVSQEEYYGGDKTPLTSGFDTCTGNLATLTLGYRKHHGYQSGTLASTRYDGMNFKAVDLTIDASTGLPSKSSDSAGVETTYTYDLLGRVTGVRPTGRAWSEYVYVNAAGETGPSVIARQCANGVTNCSATALSDSRYYYDLFGRLTQQRQRVTSSADAMQWAATWTEYVAGRKSAVSVVTGTSSPSAGPMPAGTKQTRWSYDVLDRVKSILQPDGSETRYEYPDSRVTNRSSFVAVANTFAGDWVTTTETTDFLGRLASVTEGPATAPVTTAYKYDAGDRLVSVNAGQVGQRLFHYDGAGLLTSEQHPESGVTSYGYDARGREISKRTADCHFDLNYIYDPAERLVRVDSRNDGGVNHSCGVDTWRPMKVFLFEESTSADKALGKLRQAIRYNASGFGLVRVTETLYYGDTAGRVTRKETAVENVGAHSTTTLQSFAQTFLYDQLDRLVDNVYPVCTTTACGEAPYDGVRLQYDDRGVTSVVPGNYSVLGVFSGAASLATLQHAPDGQRIRTAHANGVTEDVVPDPSGMMRPSRITFSGFATDCSAPVINSHPASASVPYQQTATLNVGASGTAPLSYQWFGTTSSEEDRRIAGATSSSYTTPPIVEVERFWVEVTSPCGKATSSEAVLTPQAQEPPDPPSSLVATRQGTTNSIAIQWSASAGAATYQVQRRNGGGFPVIATTSTTSYVDATCGAGSACVYRVVAVASHGMPSAPSNTDLALLMGFSPIGVGSVVKYSHFEEIRTAINALRDAAGLTALSWADFLPGSPPPMVNGVIRRIHLLALRDRMDEAIGTHGLPTPAYEDATPTLIRFRHMQQLRERTQ